MLDENNAARQPARRGYRVSRRKQGLVQGANTVVPAKAGTHMWTAPVPQDFFEGLIGSLASICAAC